MRIARILALSAAAIASVGLLTAPPASAATSVTVDCATQTSTSFTVSPGEEIVFTLNAACVTALTQLSIGEAQFPAFVTGIVQNNTGATITSAWNGGNLPTVTYIAGSTPGTDSIIVEPPPVQRSGLAVRHYRNGLTFETNAYYMTVPGGAGPAPWPQAIGRADEDTTCPATYGPSWAEWMNNGTGGWVCVREYYFSSALGEWAYRKG